MYIELSDKYRKVGNSLYINTGDGFVHCAVVPNRFSRSLAQAVAWFESQE